MYIFFKPHFPIHYYRDFLVLCLLMGLGFSFNAYASRVRGLRIIPNEESIERIQYVKQYVNGRGGYAILTDKSKVTVSNRKKQLFIEKMEEFAEVFFGY